MADNERRNDWTVLLAVGLIAVGVWLLLERVGGPLFQTINRVFGVVASVAWPLAILGLGVFLLVASKRGTLGKIDVRGKRLYRSRTDRMVSGVLGGLGQYLDIDSTWLRIGFVLLSIATGGGGGLIAYIIASIIIREEPTAAEAAATGSWPQPGPGSTETVQTPPPAPPVPPAPPAPPAE